MPRVPKLDSETFGDGYGTNGKAVIALDGPREKKPIFPEKSISFDDHDFSRDSTVEKIPEEENKKKKKKKHGELYKGISESFGEFAGHTR